MNAVWSAAFEIWAAKFISPKREQSLLNGYDFWRRCLLYRAHNNFFLSSRHLSHSKHIALVIFSVFFTGIILCWFDKMSRLFFHRIGLSETTTIIKTPLFTPMKQMSFVINTVFWIALFTNDSLVAMHRNLFINLFCSLNAHERSELQTNSF